MAPLTTCYGATGVKVECTAVKVLTKTCIWIRIHPIFSEKKNTEGNGVADLLVMLIFRD
jgi:hypothetical protein